MLTLNDIRKNFEEKEWPYDDFGSGLTLQTSTTGEEQVPAGVLITCNDDYFHIDCCLIKLINTNLNETVLKALNSLNLKFRLFQFALEEVDGKYRLNMRYCIPVTYISDPEVAADMLARALLIMDDAYAEIMKAKWAK